MSTDQARADLFQLINGFKASQAIYVAATLGLADHLRSGPKTIGDLATATKSHPFALYRLMRALAAVGVFREDEEFRFVLTPTAEFLRSDVSGSHTSVAQYIGRSNCWQAWGDLLYAVRSGTTAFNHVHGTGVWEYRKSHPDENGIFVRAMATGTEKFAEAVTDVY